MIYDFGCNVKWRSSLSGLLQSRPGSALFPRSATAAEDSLAFAARPYGSQPKDVPDGEAPELNEFVPDERAKMGFYKDGIPFVRVDVRVQSWGDVWVGELIVIPQEGMQFCIHNAAMTDACVVTPQYASGDPPQDHPLAPSQMD
jgi:hypothetical protein